MVYLCLIMYKQKGKIVKASNKDEDVINFTSIVIGLLKIENIYSFILIFFCTLKKHELVHAIITKFIYFWTIKM